MMRRQRDPQTGRPLQDGREVPPAALTERELDEELLVAAWAKGRHRFARYQVLAAEADRRRPVTS
jgi:hypothetical protein